MNSLCRSFLVAGLVALIGCGEQKHSPPGGPGAKPGTGTTTTTTKTTERTGTTPGTTPSHTSTTPGTTPSGTTSTTSRTSTTPDSTSSTSGTPDNTFKLEVPSGDTSIKQGESKTVTIGIERGKNFDQDVNLEFSGAPKGVTITPTSEALKAGDKNAKATIMAAKDAALGEHAITVTGTPKTGAKTTANFNIRVTKGD